MFRFDRKRFFDGFRESFGKIRTARKVAAIEDLLWFMEQDPSIGSLEEAAYMLATVAWETAHTFEPITERGSREYIDGLYDPIKGKTKGKRDRAVRYGNVNAGDGWKYRGRGYVQLTWFTNYQKLGDILGVDLVNDPDLALVPAYAYVIMSAGMDKGLFTGKSIDAALAKDFEEDGDYDFIDERMVINGKDRAQEIAQIAKDFVGILNRAIARVSEDEGAPQHPPSTARDLARAELVSASEHLALGLSLLP